MTNDEFAVIKNAVRVALHKVGKTRLSQEEFFGLNQPIAHEAKLAA